MSELTRYDVENWIKTVTGQFHYTKVLDGQVSPKLYGRLRKIMYDICHAKEPVCESIGKNDGWYRPIEELPRPIDWQNIDAQKDFPIILPFDLRKYAWIDPNTSTVVMGSKDSGKTGFIMRTIVLNMNNPNFKVVLLSNMEGGINQLKRRFDTMGVPNPAPFQVIPMVDNFHDGIKEPNTLYAIDYIDVPESGEFYMIAPALGKIQLKLIGLNSIAVIGLQKKRGSDWAYGGQQTIKKATLALAMDGTKAGYGKLKIISCKVPANPKVLPVNMTFSYKFEDEGTNFVDIKQIVEEEF